MRCVATSLSLKMNRKEIAKVITSLEEILYQNGMLVAENVERARRCTEIAKLVLSAMDTLENMRNGEK